MKQLIQFSITGIFLLHFYISTAQTTDSRYKTTDEYVQSLGPLDTLNMGTISYILTKKFPENTDKVRAIFYWIANKNGKEGQQ
jgi:hypothetical protein